MASNFLIFLQVIMKLDLILFYLQELTLNKGWATTFESGPRSGLTIPFFYNLVKPLFD